MSPENAEGAPAEGAPPEPHVHHDVTTSVSDAAEIPKQLRRRRDASLRLPPLDCGRRDPWHSPPIESTEPNRAAARRTWLHLHGHGLLSEHVEALLKGAA